MTTENASSGRIGGGTIAILLVTYSVVIVVLPHFAAPLGLLSMYIPSEIDRRTGIPGWVAAVALIVIAVLFIVGIRSAVVSTHRRTVFGLTLPLLIVVIVVCWNQFDVYRHDAWISPVTAIPFLASAAFVLIKLLRRSSE